MILLSTTFTSFNFFVFGNRLILIFSFLVIVRFLFSYPRYEITKSIGKFLFVEIENLPFTFVEVPVFSPLIKTLAPINVSLVCPS